MIFLCMVVTFFGVYQSILLYDILKELKKINAEVDIYDQGFDNGRDM